MHTISDLRAHAQTQTQLGRIVLPTLGCPPGKQSTKSKHARTPSLNIHKRKHTSCPASLSIRMPSSQCTTSGSSVTRTGSEGYCSRTASRWSGNLSSNPEKMLCRHDKDKDRDTDKDTQLSNNDKDIHITRTRLLVY